jgi:hypothetical protein
MGRSVARYLRHDRMGRSVARYLRQKRVST